MTDDKCRHRGRPKNGDGFNQDEYYASWYAEHGAGVQARRREKYATDKKWRKKIITRVVARQRKYSGPTRNVSKSIFFPELGGRPLYRSPIVQRVANIKPSTWVSLNKYGVLDTTYHITSGISCLTASQIMALKAAIEQHGCMIFRLYKIDKLAGFLDTLAEEGWWNEQDADGLFAEQAIAEGYRQKHAEHLRRKYFSQRNAIRGKGGRKAGGADNSGE